MSIDDIRNLPVRELADKNCILFMWVTFPTLREAFSVIDAWGFTYKTVAFAWVKQNKKTSSLFWGMGYWTRANVELCLLATKGSPKRHSANVHQVVFAPIAEHSKKPDIIREKIVELAGDLPRIELFARQSPTGWDVGLYVGDGMMIHCGSPISYANINTSYWQQHFYTFARLP